MLKKVLVIGAGFSGAVISNKLSKNEDLTIDVVDKRNHIAGNCHTEKCDDTGIMQHMYGAHIFHTSSRRVWDYVNKFADFRTFINSPQALVNGSKYHLPINLGTLSKFFKKEFSPEEAKRFVENNLQRKDIVEPQNFEQQALKFLGDELYNAFFYGYTVKQWGRDPKELPASILKRLPIRYTHNNNYYRSVYQGIPAEGYTKLVERLLSPDNINVSLNVDFKSIDVEGYDHVFVTMPIDEFFDYSFGRLRYRTVEWKKEVFNGDVFGHPGVNYPSLDIDFTRQREHKHYTPWENFDKTVVTTEYSKETQVGDEPYYPLSLEEDKQLFIQYMHKALSLSNYTFLGRLATYRYMDMHQVIEEALDLSDAYQKTSDFSEIPVFHKNVLEKYQSLTGAQC